MTYRWVQLNVGGTIVTDELHERPDASPTFVVRSSSGGSLATGTGTVDSVSTTLSSGAGKGATSLALTSASSVAVGRRYLVTGSEDAGGEWVTIAAISGTNVTLARPTTRDHASGASFVSTRVSCAITAVAAASVERHCRVDLTYTVSSAARPVVSIPFDVTKYALRSGLTFEHVRTLRPTVGKDMSAGTVWPDLREAAWERVVTLVGQQKDPGGMIGVVDLQQAHALMVLLMLAEQSKSDEARVDAADLRTRLDTALTTALAAQGFDDDQDGAVESHEGFYRTIDVLRG